LKQLLFVDSEMPVFHDWGMTKTAGNCFAELLPPGLMKMVDPEAWFAELNQSYH